MLLTVRDVLALEPVSRGAPRVLAGDDRLDAPVRWVHVIELAEAGHLLRGGELVLSTGIALPPDPAGLERYVAGLAAAGVSGLAVELGSRYILELPAALVSAASRHRLPLIVFERETQFIAITEAVHSRILAAHVAELSAADRVYQVFTDLALGGASEQEVVDRASELAGVPAILADLGHRVLACAGAPADELVAGFAGKSRAVGCGFDLATGWFVSSVGDWGRLVFVLGRAPVPADEVLCERAAATLTLTRMIGDRRRAAAETPARTAAGSLLRAIAGPAYADWADLHARVTALGVPLTGHQLMTVAAGTATADELATACDECGIAAICGTVDPGQTCGLLSLPPGADVDAVLAELAAALKPALVETGVPVGVGGPAGTLAEARGALLEAGQAAGAAVCLGDDRPFVRLADLGPGGLLYQLRDDPRVLAYAERQLAPLLAHDGLIEVLTVYLEAGGNKAAAAARSGLARPTLYDRLHRIERLLGGSLDVPERRLGLQVALLARACAQPARSAAS
ncbi:MAG TPA: PucR family transcriptional regulator [Streptosporangiaceae bacterium]|nr:PucR family transcriptional regulator [Streptosporangiaceae bacterium]